MIKLTLLDDGKPVLLNPQHIVAVMETEVTSNTPDTKRAKGSKLFTIIGQAYVVKESVEEINDGLDSL